MAYIETQLQNYAREKISQKELKRLLKLETSKWAATQNKKQEDKPPEESEDEEHSPFSGKVSAVLWKNSVYRKNTYSGLAMENRKDDFDVDGAFVDIAYAHLPGVAGIFKEHYGFGKMACNFNSEAEFKGSEKQVSQSKSGDVSTKTGGSGQKTAGCSMPYKWNAHHMIPGSAFYKQIKGATSSAVFTEDQFILLLMSDYDVNNGHNMIPLPDAGMDFYQPVHKMLLHPSDHKQYTQMVQNKMKVVSDSLKKIKKKADEPHPNISVELAKELKELETNLWDFIVGLGEKSVTSEVTKKRARLDREERGVLGSSGQFGSLK